MAAPATLDDLTGAARNGDSDAFAGLVRLTYADTYALAYRLTGNVDDACDVLQDAYLRAFKSIKRFRGEAGFATWMYRVTANCAVTHLARGGRRNDTLDACMTRCDERVVADPAAMAAADDDRVRLVGALRRLSDPLRAVVVLRDIYDWPHELVAAELGISVATAKVRAHRGRKKLREWLFPMAGDPQAGDPQAADPQAGDPQAGDPQAGDPQAGDPQAADPQAADFQAADPQAGDPQAGDPQSADPRSGGPGTEGRGLLGLDHQPVAGVM